MIAKNRILTILVAVLMVFAMLPATAAPTFAESDVDTEAPVIDMDSLTTTLPEGKEKVTVGDTVTFSASITDNREVSYVNFGFYSPLSGRENYNYAAYDEESGLWTATFTVTDETESGLWRCGYVSVRDQSGNSTMPRSPFRGGDADLSCMDFEVEGTSADPDVEAPVIDMDSLTTTLPEGKEKVTVGDTVTFSASITDNREVSYVNFGFYSPLSGRENYNYAAYDEESGLWTATFTVTDETESGLWRCGYVSVRDQSGNSTMPRSPFRGGNADLSCMDFEVEGTSADPDVEAPVIDMDSLTTTLPEGKEKVTVGDTVTFSASITDNREVSYVNFGFYSPLSGRENYNYAAYDEESGLWTATFTVTDETESGLWRCGYVSVRDQSGNSTMPRSPFRGGNTDLSCMDFEVIAPECPLDLTTEGYSMMLDGAGATALFGGNYYVNYLDETVTPTVKVRFDAEDGTWTTLSPRKYTLKFEKKTGEDSWEDYTGDTFGVNESGTAAYRVSAIGKESLYYSGTVGPVEFNVTKKAKVTFDSRGGSSIDPQYIIPGEKADEPEAPAKDNSFFDGWYADEELTEPFSFDTAVNEDITIYAKWKDAITLTVGVYDKTNSKSGQGGTYTFNDEDMTHTIAKHTVPLGSEVTLAAAPADGYRFEGWTLGRVTGSGDEMLIQPLDGDLVNTEASMKFEAGPVYAGYAICAVFREISDTPPVIDISTLQIQPPEERQSDRIVTAGDSINISVKITDNGTVKKALAWFLNDYKPASEEDESYLAVKKVSLSRQDNDLWTGVLKIDSNTETGEWNLGYVEADDDNNNHAAIYNSASYYEEDFSPYTDLSEYDFSVEKSYTVTFDSHGGTGIPPQTVIAGRMAAKPADPSREGWYFEQWYSDENLTNTYWFSEPVNSDITLYADWITSMCVGIYNESNPDKNECGTIDIETSKPDDDHSEVQTMNFTAHEGTVKFTARPAEGYSFKGWYKGVIGSSHYVETPSDELLSQEKEYTCEAEEAAICAVFECAGHQWDEGTVSKPATCQESGTKVFKCTVCGTEKSEEIPVDADAHIWEQHIQKATPDAEGRTWQQCTICGTEETGMPIPKVSNISLEGTSFTYTGKAITPKVTVANAGEPLSDDYYTVTYSNNINPGTAKATVTLKGEYYEGTKELTFTITKPADEGGDGGNSGSGTTPGGSGTKPSGSGVAPGGTDTQVTKSFNPMKVKAKTVKVNYSKLINKKQIIKANKAFTVTDAQGKVTFKVVKYDKKAKKRIKVSKNGKITIKKGLKKGTYRLKVAVTAAGNANYDGAAKVVKLKVKVR